MTAFLSFLPMIVAPFVLCIWSLVSAYVFKLGVRGSGIGFDYIVFTLVVVLGCVLGGVF